MPRLRLAPIEYKVCPTDGIEYEGGQCPQCGHSSDPQTVRRVMHDRLILVSVDPLIYKREARLRCSNKECGNLYAAVQCPLCGAPKPQRPTMVWVRTFAVGESLETETEEVNHDVEDGDE